jgi:cytochrome c oxidase cbb3-type subunit 3
MPAHRPILGETRSRLVAAYVWSLSAQSRDNPPDTAAGGAPETE